MLRVDPWNVLFIVINLIVLYVIMRFLVVRPIQNIIKKREDIIQSGLRNAENSQANAKAIEHEWNKRIANFKEESAQMMIKAKSDAAQEYDKLVGEAQQEAQRIIGSARKQVEEERAKVISDLQTQIADVAIDATKKVLENSDLTGINNSLYEKFLTEAGDGNDSDSN